jgi:hypothetical protein
MSLKKIGKIAIIVAIIIAGLAVLLGGGAAALYWFGIRKNAPVEQVGPLSMVPEQAELGQVVRASVMLKCPWHRKPVEAVAAVGKGASLVEEPTMTRIEIGPGYTVWQVAAEFKPYRTGTVPPGKLEVKFNRYNKQTKDLGMDFNIPSLQVKPLNLGKESKLQIAAKIDEPASLTGKGRYYLIGGIAAVLAVIALLVWRFRARRGSGRVVITPWGTALLELSDLRVGLKSGNVSLDLCFGRLTDIVREYLEKRFKLHASKQTTYEFLEDINQPEGPLPDKHRPFLKEFMTAADLVKFAKLPPDEAILDNALDKAETLVSETRPDNQNNTQAGGEK